MRVELTVYVDSADELRDALLATAAAMPADVFASRKGFAINVWPDCLPSGALSIEAHPSQIDPPAAAVPAAETAPAETTDEAPAPAKRTRRTKAQIEADNAAKAGQDAAGTAPPVTTAVPGGEAADEAGEAPAAPAADDDPLGLGGEPEAPAAPQMSGPEAKNKALEILRECYALAGGPAAVKEVQRAFNVGKFAEVGDALGHKLMAAAEAAKAKLAGAAS